MASRNKRLTSPFSLIVLIVSISLGTYFYFLNRNLTQKLTQAQTELQAKDEDIERYIRKRGKQLKTTTEQYAFTTFGIYSPLLKNSNVEVSTYDYLKNTVTARTISLGQYKNHKVNIETWELTKTVKDSGNLPPISETKIGFKIPIFDGYENYSLTPRLEPTESSNVDLYISKRNIYMTLHENPAPHMIESISYEYYSPTSPSKNPIYVIVSVNVNSSPINNDANINNALTVGKEIADTIDNKIYDN